MRRAHKCICLIGTVVLAIGIVLELLLDSWLITGSLFFGAYLLGWGLAGWRLAARHGAAKRGNLELEDGSVLGCQSPRVLYQSPDYERYVDQAREYFK